MNFSEITILLDVAQFNTLTKNHQELRMYDEGL